MKVQKVSIIIEGKPNKLYAQGMSLYHLYDWIEKLGAFLPG